MNATGVMQEQAIACIVCGCNEVSTFLDLGRTALANHFLTREGLSLPEPRHPLRAGFCHGCSHVQLMERVAAEELFRHYLYMSSASDTLHRHLYELSDVIVQRFQLQREDFVIDIGCNDGTLLRGFRRHGVRTLGVDPAENLAELTKRDGVERYVGFFNLRTSQSIVERWGRASAIVATNTFPHITDLHDFIEGIKTALAPGGMFVIELHYLIDLLDQGAFDTIYHEHVSYWSLTALEALFTRTGMRAVDVERLPLHHGQLRVFVQREGEGPVHPSVGKTLAFERARGLGKFDTYQRFARQVRQRQEELTTVLHDLVARGQRIAGYGAPAKASTLLEFLGLNQRVLEYVVDRSPLKQGRYMPGSHIPIVSPERLLQDHPNYLLVLAWNFADEIMGQQAEYRRRGGKFILPLPRVSIV